MSLKRIVFFTTHFGPGGAETQILRLALMMKSRGYDVSVISMMKALGFVDQLEDARIGYYCLEMERGKASTKDVFKMVSLLRKLKPDVIANFCFHANLLGSLVGKLCRVPVIITSIRGESSGSRKREYLERIISSSRISDWMITNSTIVASALIERGVVSSNRIGVIYNGIYTNAYSDKQVDRALIREQLSLHDGEFCWLAVGNISAAKDYSNLLGAFALLKEKEPSAQLRIAGGLWHTDLKSQLDELMNHYKLNGHVQFLGQRQDVIQLLHAADAHILSSKTEGLPNAVMEAMATGLPVVATDVGGVRELVKDRVTGFVVPRQEPESLAQAMIKMMALSDKIRAQMGAAGQKHIRENFELDVVCQQWEDLFIRQFENKH